MTDLALAIVHHLIVFGIAAVLAAGLALMRAAAMSSQIVKLLGRFEAAYGILALAIGPTLRIASWQKRLKVEAVHAFAGRSRNAPKETGGRCRCNGAACAP